MHGLTAPEARKTRSYEYAEANFDVASAMTLSGLDYMRALASGALGARPSMIDTLGMSAPLDLDHGKAAMEAEPADFLLNPMGTVHGGFAATLLDSVMGIAVHTALEPAFGYTTVELKVNFTRAILPTTSRLRAEGAVIHLGRQMATAEGRIFALADNKLYAHGSTTCFLFPLRRREG